MVFAGAFLVSTTPGHARAPSLEPKKEFSDDQKAALAASQAAMGRLVGDYAFRDTAGNPVRISDLRGKPLIVSFIYTSCAQSCPVITASLLDAIDVGRETLGADGFNVVTVGFDVASDTPERLRLFAARNNAGNGNWKFLSGDIQTVGGLADDLGFQFSRSAKGFDHIDQITVIDAEGRVYRQIYGEAFDPPILVDPLMDLTLGTRTPFASIDDLIKKVRLFCTIYDPAAGRYKFDYSLFVQMIVGTSVIGFLLVFVGRNWWRILRQKSSSKTPPHGPGIPKAS